jgi:hypothetical protein
MIPFLCELSAMDAPRYGNAGDRYYIPPEPNSIALSDLSSGILEDVDV